MDDLEGKSPLVASAANDDEDDPVVATYSVFMKPPLPDNKKLLILQYVNKTAQDPTTIRQPRITEMRVKPKTGMIEVDVPIDTTQVYDQGKGIKWGTMLQKSMETKKGGSLGLAGGFGIGGHAVRSAGGRSGGGNDDNNPTSWAEATRQDKVLRTQTLGGGRSTEEENAKYMVGVFQGKNIHLTPVSSLIHLRPVPYHIDAVAEQEKLSRPAPSGAAAAAAEKAAGRAIQMTLKAAMDDQGVATETMADRLRSVQSETWRRIEWFEDETKASWEAYNELLLMRSEASAAAKQQDAEDDKSKGKEVATDAPVDDSGAPDLVEKVTQLRTDWGEDELLRAVSGIEAGDPKPGEEAVTQKDAERLGPKGKGKGPEPAPAVKDEPEEPKKRPGRPARRAAVASAATKRGRARVASGSGPSDAMQID
ncbi:Sin-like protein conserved region-domain-containing protein [Cercophora newfieldiana]|uniref:Sin-like protein conserved region-domain-containing protein n=1 Tax=Cercophora newfieldiana TaxID=92897 RepID=A0AA39Y108_9PEZI|nr:Sin-like protein conserved region-domain-containing protein [Cercophora newfieldiana]